MRSGRSAPSPSRTHFCVYLLGTSGSELAFEIHRWPALLRFEPYIDGVARARVSAEFDRRSGLTRLFPIPQRELDIGDLEQNHDYAGGQRNGWRVRRARGSSPQAERFPRCP